MNIAYLSLLWFLSIRFYSFLPRGLTCILLVLFLSVFFMLLSCIVKLILYINFVYTNLVKHILIIYL